MRIVWFVLIVLNSIAAVVNAWKGDTAWVALNMGVVIALLITTPTKAKW